jgi:hypothetical protein
MRVQFEEVQPPPAAWWFGETIDAVRLQKPPKEDPRRLTCSVLGYLEHTFTQPCKSMVKYGIAWEWLDAASEGEGMLGSGGNWAPKELGARISSVMEPLCRDRTVTIPHADLGISALCLVIPGARLTMVTPQEFDD